MEGRRRGELASTRTDVATNAENFAEFNLKSQPNWPRKSTLIRTVVGRKQKVK